MIDIVVLVFNGSAYRIHRFVQGIAKSQGFLLHISNQWFIRADRCFTAIAVFTASNQIVGFV